MSKNHPLGEIPGGFSLLMERRRMDKRVQGSLCDV